MPRRRLNYLLNRIVKRLVRRFDPEQIILFGSYARGTARPDSDIDLLVVLPLRGSKRAKQIEMRMALRDIPIPKDIVVVTPEEVTRQRHIVGTLIKPALQEGKVLYYAHQKSSCRSR
jgi:predicted nucleotidyltransferase